jgi:hypothetical protein
VARPRWESGEESQWRSLVVERTIFNDTTVVVSGTEFCPPPYTCYATATGVFVNCLFLNSSVSALADKNDGWATAELSISHNTFFIDSPSIAVSWTDQQTGYMPGYLNVNVRNNIFYGYSGECALRDQTTDYHDITVKRTLFGSDDPDHTCPYSDAYGWWYCSIFGQLYPDNTCADPLFLDPGNGDYHLSAASPAVDYGAMSAPSVDFDGDARPQGFGPDAGFDEVNRSVQVDILREDCDSYDPPNPSLADIFPFSILTTPVILSGLDFPGSEVDPETGILSNRNLPLLFYQVWPSEAGNCLRLTKEHSSDSITLRFGY